MATRHRRPTAILAPAVLAVVAPLSACGRNDPQGAAGNDPRQGRANSECRQAFDLARLRLGGTLVDTVHELDRLAASAAVDGDRASVRLTSGGQSARFELVKASSSEQAQFLAPDTEWRIAGGALPLIPKQEA